MSTTIKQVEAHLIYTGAVTIGDIERIAGIDTTNRAERIMVWEKFKHLRSIRQPGERTDPQCAAVMRECKKMTAKQVNSGRLCLWPAILV